MIILLPIENTKREFYSRLLIGYYALIAGHDFVIGRKQAVRMFAKTNENTLYLGKSNYNHDNPYKDSLISGIHVILDEEGLVYSSKEKLIKRANLNQSDYDLYLTWGEEQKKILDNFYHHEKKTIVTGNPRVDLLKPKYDSFFKNNIMKLRKKYNKYTLITTSFAKSNFRYQDSTKTSDYMTHHIKRGVNYKKPLSKKDIKDLKTQIKIKKTEMDLFCEFLKEVLIKSDLNFILKPHPDENSNYWREKFKKYPNFYVINDINTRTLISGSEGVIHTGSTTGIESAYLNKNVYFFSVYRPSSVNLAHKFGYPISSSSDYFSILSGKTINIKKHKYYPDISNFIYQDQETDSAKIIMNVINNLIFSFGFKKSNFNASLTKIRKGKLYYKICIRKILNIFKALTLKKYSTKFDKIEKIDIVSGLNMFSDINKINVNHSIKRIYHDTYYICGSKSEKSKKDFVYSD